jgi:hypothetical protein
LRIRLRTFVSLSEPGVGRLDGDGVASSNETIAGLLSGIGVG